MSDGRAALTRRAGIFDDDETMRKVFVSGCYDVLHAGHVRFFEDARALGDHLTVCVATDEVLRAYKRERSSLPHDNKLALVGALRFVLRDRPDVLAVTEDDRNQEQKRQFCAEHGIEFVVLSKRNDLTPVSTTGILAGILDRSRVPLRVDFAGGWLDVPALARAGGYIVNCAIQPLVSLDEWPYEIGGGHGGYALYLFHDRQAAAGRQSTLVVEPYLRGGAAL